MTEVFAPMDPRVALAQIPLGVRLAVSGGRAELHPDALVLPIGRGRQVEIRLTAADLYHVVRTRRVLRGANRGEVICEVAYDGIYCDDLGRVVMDAGHWK